MMKSDIFKNRCLKPPKSKFNSYTHDNHYMSPKFTLELERGHVKKKKPSPLTFDLRDRKYPGTLK